MNTVFVPYVIVFLVLAAALFYVISRSSDNEPASEPLMGAAAARARKRAEMLEA